MLSYCVPVASIKFVVCVECCVNCVTFVFLCMCDMICV